LDKQTWELKEGWIDEAVVRLSIAQNVWESKIFFGDPEKKHGFKI
jgi:hypothetical protein